MAKNPEESTCCMDVFGYSSKKQVISGKVAFGGVGEI